MTTNQKVSITATLSYWMDEIARAKKDIDSGEFHANPSDFINARYRLTRISNEMQDIAGKIISARVPALDTQSPEVKEHDVLPIYQRWQDANIVE